MYASIHREGDEKAVVDQSETVIIVDYDLTDGFTIEVNVGAIQNNQTTNEAYGPEGERHQVLRGI